MEKNKEKEFDALLQRRIKGEGLEEPSLDFTKNIISKLEADQLPSPLLVYKPLISKPIWYAFAFVVFGLFVFLTFGDYDMGIGLISDASIDELKQIQISFLENLSRFNISKIYV